MKQLTLIILFTSYSLISLPTAHGDWIDCIKSVVHCGSKLTDKLYNKPGPLAEFFPRQNFNCCYIWQANDCVLEEKNIDCSKQGYWLAMISPNRTSYMQNWDTCRMNRPTVSLGTSNLS